MKNIIFIPFLISFNSFAQTFGEPGDEWHNYSLIYAEPSLPGMGTTTNHRSSMTKYVGDTIVDEDSYQIFVKCLKSWSETEGDTPFYYNQRFYVFQDSAKIFYGLPGDMDLFYDFNLEAGDSTEVFISYIGASIHMHVEETDSVIIDGTWRKRIIFEDIGSSEGLRWIEGVGDEVHGLFKHPSGYYDEYYSFCMKHENEVQVGTCGIIYTCPVEFVNITPEEEAKELMIYPNPFLDNLTINAPSNLSAPYSVSIFNHKGELVYESIELTQILQVDLSELSKGLYLVMVTDENGVRTSKIVKG